MLEEIGKIATDVAKRKGATLLLDKAGPTLIGVSNVIYADAAYEITDEVMKEINKDRQASAPASAAPAAAPAADGAPKITVPGVSPEEISFLSSVLISPGPAFIGGAFLCALIGTQFLGLAHGSWIAQSVQLTISLFMLAPLSLFLRFPRRYSRLRQLGDTSVPIGGIAALKSAQVGDLSFLGNSGV